MPLIGTPITVPSFGALAVELVGHRHAAGGRLVLHDDARMARDVVDDVTRDNACEQVVAAADRGTHDHPQLLALVERGDIVLCAGRGRADA
jgi:hypothetical protein